MICVDSNGLAAPANFRSASGAKNSHFAIY
jgi:hypothetical protein